MFNDYEIPHTSNSLFIRIRAITDEDRVNEYLLVKNLSIAVCKYSPCDYVCDIGKYYDTNEYC